MNKPVDQSLTGKQLKAVSGNMILY